MIAFRGASVTPSAVSFPSTTYPAPLANGSSGIMRARVTFDSYDPHGRLMSYTDPVGTVVAFTYFVAPQAHPTREGFLAARTIAPGTLDLVTRYRVNEAGEIVAVTDAAGRTTEYRRDPCSLVRTTISPLTGYAVSATYDGNLQATSYARTIVQPDGTVAMGSPELQAFTYNSELSPVLSSFGDSSGTPPRSTRRVYDSSNQLVRVILPRGNAVCYEYDERGLLKRATRGCCTTAAATTSYDYDADGCLLATTDARGGTTTARLDAFGRAVGITDPLGTLQRIDYDALNNVTVRRWFGTDGAGTFTLLRRHEVTYDERGSATHLRQALFSAPIVVAEPWSAPDAEYVAALGTGVVQIYEDLLYYDARLRVFRVVDAEGHATDVSYDAAARPIARTDTVGSTDLFSYDAASNIVRRDRCNADATGIIRAVISSGYEYDGLNRLVAVTDGAGNRTSSALDSRGLLRQRTDGLGQMTSWAYDGFRECITEAQSLLVSGHAPTLLTTTLQYDLNGNVVGFTDPNGNTTLSKYDVLDRVVGVTNPDGTSRRLAYDAAGNVVQQVDENGTVVRRTFDAGNRLRQIAVQSAEAIAPAEGLVTFSYDGVGTLLHHETDFVAVRRTCDSLGRCHREQLTFAARLKMQPVSIAREFDRLSNVTAVQYPSGQSLALAYDGARRLVAIESTAKAAQYPGDPSAAARRAITTKQWWGNLPVASRFGSGVIVSTAYDVAARRIADTCSLAGGAKFIMQQLWDGAGNRALNVVGLTTRLVGSRCGYDSTNRLTVSREITLPQPFNPALLTPPSVPPAGIVLAGQSSIDAVIGRYRQGARDLELVYDAAGNRVNESNAAARTLYRTNVRNEYARVGSKVLRYDRAGRLAGDGRFAYAYNFRGQLVEARSTTTGVSVLEVYHDALGRSVGIIEGRRTRGVVRDGANALEYYDDGLLSAVHIFEGQEQLCFIAAHGRDRYVVRDVLESTRLTTSSKGAAAAVYDYDAFGALTVVPADASILYSGKYRYASIDWYDYSQRQYIPSLGRFAQPDPTGFRDGPNLYAYVGNNPLSGRDASGTERQDVAPAARQSDADDSSDASLKGPAVAKPPLDIGAFTITGHAEAPNTMLSEPADATPTVSAHATAPLPGAVAENSGATEQSTEAARNLGRESRERAEREARWAPVAKGYLEFRFGPLERASEALANSADHLRSVKRMAQYKGSAKAIRTAAKIELEDARNQVAILKSLRPLGWGLNFVRWIAFMDLANDALRIRDAIAAGDAEEILFSLGDTLLDVPIVEIAKPLTGAIMIDFVEANIKKGPGWQRYLQEREQPSVAP